MICIINYGGGNLRSVENILKALGQDYIISNKKEDILASQKIIFPGQGHFGQSMTAIKEFNVDKFAIAGGVASNSHLRDALEKACKEAGVSFYKPSPILCTDNAAMIGAAGYYEFINGNVSGYDLNAIPNLRLGER